MLILSRRQGESLVITTGNGEQITIKHLTVKGRQVKVGIDAPKTTNIVREEVNTRRRKKERDNNDRHF